MFQILHQNAPYRKHRNIRFFLFCLVDICLDFDQIFNPSYIVEDLVCYWMPRARGASLYTIFTSAMSFKVVEQLENLTPIWKCVEAELPSLPYLNNLEKLGFVKYFHTNIFCLIDQYMISFYFISYSHDNYFTSKI